MYDFDVRIHLTVTGPGISKGSVIDFPATNVDLAPTFLALGGVDVHRDDMDGRSLVPLLIPKTGKDVPKSVLRHIEEAGPGYADTWRDAVFIE